MSSIDLYDISAKKFEELALDFVKAQDELSVIYSPETQYRDLGYDFKASFQDDIGNHHLAAIEVKHRKLLRKNDLNKIISNAERIKENFEIFILVTSAVIIDEHLSYLIESLEKIGYSVVRVYQKEHLDLAIELPKSLIAKRILEEKRASSLSRRLAMFSFLIGIIGSLVSVSSFFLPPQVENSTLDSRIQNVEGALKSINDLESYLSSIKMDMKETQVESQVIQKEYEKSQVLKELTEKQMSAVRSAIGNTKAPWWSKILDYVVGFAFGVGGSIVASFIYDKIKRNRELDAPV